jgi:multidrug efflux pump subunit AcrA (membrane-fusion protein)
MAGVGSFFGQILGSADPAQAPAAIVSSAQKILSLFKKDPNLQAQLDQQITLANLDLDKTQLAAELAQAQGQLAINQQEAASANWFVAGWRPYIGWVCGTGLLYAILLQPLLTFILLAAGVKLPTDQLPKLDLGQILAILSPMLGLGVARSVEKITGTAGNH